MTVLRWFTAGESHGPSLTVLLEGLPAGLPLTAARLDRDLARRQKGYGRGGRMKIERDRVVLEAGVRDGVTLGSPLVLRIENRDFEAWRGRMGPEPLEPPPEPVTTPRPGHADLAGGLKYDRHDLRDVLERASARETAARVAAGAVARALLAHVGVTVHGRVLSIAGIADPTELQPEAYPDHAEALERSELRVLDPDAEARMREAILSAGHDGDTVGGVVEVVALGVPPGLGSHVHWDRRLDGRLAQAVVSIQAIKALELGDGWRAASVRGSDAHDPIGYDPEARRFTRGSNRAGGVEGGVSNGEPVVVRAAMKPIATLRRPLASVDVRSKVASPALVERGDVCAVPAASVVVEAMVLLVLAAALLEKSGGDSLGEVLANVEAARARGRAY